MHKQTLSFWSYDSHSTELDAESQRGEVICTSPRSKEWHELNPGRRKTRSSPGCPEVSFLRSHLPQPGQIEPLPREERNVGNNRPRIFFFLLADGHIFIPRSFWCLLPLIAQPTSVFD